MKYISYSLMRKAKTTTNARPIASVLCFIADVFLIPPCRKNTQRTAVCPYKKFATSVTRRITGNGKNLQVLEIQM